MGFYRRDAKVPKDFFATKALRRPDYFNAFRYMEGNGVGDEEVGFCLD
jgi:hypothetical protein